MRAAMLSPPGVVGLTVAKGGMMLSGGGRDLKVIRWKVAVLQIAEN
jgi:hypothetical protein